MKGAAGIVVLAVIILVVGAAAVISGVKLIPGDISNQGTKQMTVKGDTCTVQEGIYIKPQYGYYSCDRAAGVDAVIPVTLHNGDNWIDCNVQTESCHIKFTTPQNIGGFAGIIKDPFRLVFVKYKIGDLSFTPLPLPNSDSSGRVVIYNLQDVRQNTPLIDLDIQPGQTIKIVLEKNSGKCIFGDPKDDCYIPHNDIPQDILSQFPQAVLTYHPYVLNKFDQDSGVISGVNQKGCTLPGGFDAIALNNLPKIIASTDIQGGLNPPAAATKTGWNGQDFLLVNEKVPVFSGFTFSPQTNLDFSLVTYQGNDYYCGALGTLYKFDKIKTTDNKCYAYPGILSDIQAPNHQCCPKESSVSGLCGDDFKFHLAVPGSKDCSTGFVTQCIGSGNWIIDRSLDNTGKTARRAVACSDQVCQYESKQTGCGTCLSTQHCEFDQTSGNGNCIANTKLEPNLAPPNPEPFGKITNNGLDLGKLGSLLLGSFIFALLMVGLIFVITRFVPIAKSLRGIFTARNLLIILLAITLIIAVFYSGLALQSASLLS